MTKTKKEIGEWLKDLEKRDRKAAGFELDDEDYPRWMEHHYTVIIPKDVYDQLPPDEQDKFEGCDLDDHTDFVEEEYGVESDELNDLWERKYFDLPSDDYVKWIDLGNNSKGEYVDEVLIFEC